MKKLYGYNGELEKKIIRIEEASSSEVVAEMIAEQLDIAEDTTVGEFMLAMLSYMFDIPKDVWSKTSKEVDREEVEKFIEMFERDCVTFVQE